MFHLSYSYIFHLIFFFPRSFLSFPLLSFFLIFHVYLLHKVSHFLSLSISHSYRSPSLSLSHLDLCYLTVQKYSVKRLCQELLLLLKNHSTDFFFISLVSDSVLDRCLKYFSLHFIFLLHYYNIDFKL